MYCVAVRGRGRVRLFCKLKRGDHIIGLIIQMSLTTHMSECLLEVQVLSGGPGVKQTQGQGCTSCPRGLTYLSFLFIGRSLCFSISSHCLVLRVWSPTIGCACLTVSSPSALFFLGGFFFFILYYFHSRVSDTFMFRISCKNIDYRFFKFLYCYIDCCRMIKA